MYDTSMSAKKRTIRCIDKSPCFSTLATTNDNSIYASPNRNNKTDAGDGISTLQELAGDVIRKQVEDERKNIIRNHSTNFERKRANLEIRRDELRRQLQEVEEEMKCAEIDHQDEMLKELDHFDNEVQPEILGVLTDTGQLDRICPLCEQYFRSSTDLPNCSLGHERCYMHTVQRCCFSCLRPSFYDIFQCLAFSDSTGDIHGSMMGGAGGILDDLAAIETAAETPTWMLNQIFGEGVGGIRKEEYAQSATVIAAAAIRLVPSETGSVNCPVCRQQYCDHDFLYHFAACCRRAFNPNNGIVFCLEACE